MQLSDSRDPWLSVSKFPFLPELDGLRAIAIAIVFFGHVGLGQSIIPGGLGVTIFFFLSGYLITSLLRVEMGARGAVSVKGFYTRRFLRIIPPLWISIAVFGLASAAGLVPTALDPVAILGQLFFAINYMEPFGRIEGVPGMPLWSLAVEEHYYLIFPAAYILLVRHFNVRKMAQIFAIACIAALVFRLIHVFAFGDTYYTYYFTHTRFDSILFGAVLALWNNPVLEKDAWRPKPWQFWLAALLLLATIVPRSEAYRETIRYTLQGLVLFVLFAGVLSYKNWVSRILSSPPFQLVGRYSYTLYLSHLFFIEACHQLVPSLPVLVNAAVAGAFAFAYSALMYRLVERPAAKLRRRLNPVEAPAPVAPQAADVAPSARPSQAP